MFLTEPNYGSPSDMDKKQLESINQQKQQINNFKLEQKIVPKKNNLQMEPLKSILKFNNCDQGSPQISKVVFQKIFNILKSKISHMQNSG